MFCDSNNNLLLDNVLTDKRLCVLEQSYEVKNSDSFKRLAVYTCVLIIEASNYWQFVPI